LAHDFNNLLTAIIGNTELLALDIESESGQERLHSLNLIFDQAQNLTSQLLTISSRDIYQPSTLELDSELARLVSLLKTTVGAGVHLELQFSAAGSHVPLNFSQLGQILINLTSNARDAVGGKGHVVVCTKADATRAYITVRDDGDGMTLPTIQRAFEPFFTTKKIGEGTGLGLSTVYGIVKQNKGYIVVDSKIGEGTTFTIYLPRYVEKSDPDTTQDSEAPLRGGHETVLLVEDEPSILNMSRAILEKLGYRVLAAAAPDEALGLAKNQAEIFHLLLTDMIMPTMSGLDLAKRLQALHPELKCLFMSGYMATSMTQPAPLVNITNFIQKPFSMRDLANKIRDVLEDKCAAERSHKETTGTK